MRYIIKDRLDAFEKEYYEVIDTKHTLTKDGDYAVGAFDDLQDAKICVAKLNGIKGGVLWDGSSSEYGTDYFELEELIAITANVESDIDALIDKITRNKEFGYHMVEIEEILKSIKNLHSLRYERVFDYFSEMIKKGYIKPSEIYEEV